MCFFSVSLPVVGCISVCGINQLGSLCIVIKCDSFHTFIQVNGVAEEWYLSYGRITASCASMTERFYSFTAISVSLNLMPAVRKLISLSQAHTVFILCCDFIMQSNTTNWKKKKWVNKFNMRMFHISYCVKFYKRIWPRKSEEYLCLYCLFFFLFPACSNIHEKNPLSVEPCPKSHTSLSKLERGRLQFDAPIVWCSTFSHWRTGMTTFVSTLSPCLLPLLFFCFWIWIRDKQ